MDILFNIYLSIKDIYFFTLSPKVFKNQARLFFLGSFFLFSSR
jgi:hypothetical protein